MSKMEHWTGGPGGNLDVIFTLTTYLVVYVSFRLQITIKTKYRYLVISLVPFFFLNSDDRHCYLGSYFFIQFILVAICVSLAVPAGIFVPSFVIGACGGRIVGELMVNWFPEGLRGLDGPQIYPGLYAVVGNVLYSLYYK